MREDKYPLSLPEYIQELIEELTYDVGFASENMQLLILRAELDPELFVVDPSATMH